jgi:cytochrome c oxidase subunit 3
MAEATAVAASRPIDEADVPLAHHFDDPEQQHQTAILGMWAFLATEVMFFGGVIAAYTVYRATSPHEFAAASRTLEPMIGAFNTLVLLGSSLAVALAVRSSQLRDRTTTLRLLAITIVLGTAFLGIKGYEWSLEFQHHLVPGYNFHYDEPDAGDLNLGRVQMFFIFYFAMTGLHAFHMIIGLAILAILFVQIYRRKLPATGERPVEITGLYWHFVDIVWVFLSDHHVLPVRTYLNTFLILVALLGAAVGAAYLPLGPLHLPATLLIASVKAVIIMMIFMHLRFSNRLTWAFAVGAFVWLALLIVLTMSDYLSRGWLAIPGK